MIYISSNNDRHRVAKTFQLINILFTRYIWKLHRKNRMFLYSWSSLTLNAELNPIRHLLALVGARHIVHVSRIRVS